MRRFRRHKEPVKTTTPPMTMADEIRAAVALLSASTYASSIDASAMWMSFTDEERMDIGAVLLGISTRLVVELADAQKRPVNELLAQIGRKATRS